MRITWTRRMKQAGWAYAAVGLATVLVWGEALRSRMPRAIPVVVEHVEPAASAPATEASTQIVSTAPAATGPLSPSDRTLAIIRAARNLGSPISAEREAAEKGLLLATHRERRLLRQLAGDPSTAPAAKALLMKRVDELDAQVANNPPPVSLHLQNAGLFDLVEALNNELGVQMRTATAGAGRFTIDVNEQPLWPTVQSLNKQASINIAPGPELLWSIVPARVGAGLGGGLPLMDNSAVQDLFFFTADAYVGAAARGTAPSRVILRYTLLADPRVRLLDASPMLTVGSDDLGNGFTSNTPNVVGAGRSGTVPATARPTLIGNGLMQNVQLTVPGNGRFMRSLQLTGKATVGLTFARETVTNPTEGQQISVGKTRVTLKQFRMEGTVLRLGLDTQMEGQMPYAVYTLIDGNGRQRMQMMTQGSLAASLPGPIPSPMTLQIEAPQSVRQVDFAMELKDVPLVR